MSLLSSLAVFALLATTTSVPAPGLAVSDLSVNHGTVPQTKKVGDDTVGFFAIHNDGDTADKLTAWSCNISNSTALVDASGKPMTDLTIPAHKTVILAANGPHLILKGNRYIINRGSVLPCAMTFTNEGALQLLLYALDTKKN